MIRPIHITTALGPALALLVFWLLNTPEQDSAIAFTAAITIWTAVWWIFEPIPIPATSLLPLALFPAVGVLTPTEVGAAYGSPLVLLLMGGFILSTAMERSGAHRRVALTMVNLFGGSSSKRLVFGFMAAAALLSMWISNTATTLMLLPVAMAVLEKAPDKKLAIPLLLGIAYASSIGGIGTPIGTPPNLVFQQVYAETVGSEIGFLTWMSWGVPVVLIFVPITALWLTRGLDYQGSFILPAVGTWQSAERRVLIVFALTALAWVTRSQPFGGWSTFLNVPGINDAGVAMLAVVVMFLVPDGRGERLLNWESAAKIPWGMLILFGGGIAIAKAFVASGLSQQLGDLADPTCDPRSFPSDTRDLPHHHVYDRDYQQHGNDDFNVTHSGGGCLGGRNSARDPYGACCHECKLRIYATGSNRSQHHHVQHWRLSDQNHGQRGPSAQPDWRFTDHQCLSTPDLGHRSLGPKDLDLGAGEASNSDNLRTASKNRS